MSAATRSWRGRLADWAALLLTVQGLAWLGGLAGDWWWPLGLLQHFPVQQAILAGVLGAILLATGQRRWAALAGGLLAWHAAWAAPAWWPQAPAAGSGPGLRIAAANVLAFRADSAEAVAALRAMDAEVLAVLECTPAWERRLRAEFARSHPHQLGEARDDAFGILLLSRWPLADAAVISLDGVTPSILAEVHRPDLRLRVLATHPPPPMRAAVAGIHRRHLRAIPALLASSTGPVAVIGDLNATPTSSAFRRLLADAALRDSRRGHGHGATWPAALGAFGIPIDHILLRRAAARTRGTAAIPGSDHRAVWAEVVPEQGP